MIRFNHFVAFNSTNWTNINNNNTNATKIHNVCIEQKTEKSVVEMGRDVGLSMPSEYRMDIAEIVANFPIEFGVWNATKASADLMPKYYISVSCSQWIKRESINQRPAQQLLSCYRFVSTCFHTQCEFLFATFFSRFFLISQLVLFCALFFLCFFCSRFIFIVSWFAMLMTGSFALNS